MMIKNCVKCGQSFEITDADLDFYDKISPVFNHKKYQIPPPTFCPQCREQRRLSWQNIMHLYQRSCDFSKKPILSNFSPDKKLKVYENEIWWSDQWDPCAMGRDFDFNRPFFDQFAELMAESPFPNLSRRPSSDENCDYTNYALSDKNCYLIFHANNNEDCLYGFGIKFCKDAIDTLNAFSSELLYECIDCENGYNLKFCQDCEHCSNSVFLHDCLGCKNCIACHGLQNTDHHIFNKKVSPETFRKTYNEIINGSHAQILNWKEKFNTFKQNLPHRALFEKQNESCTGDHLYRCKNVQESFDVKDTQDAKFCTRIFNGPNSDCYDLNQFGMQIEKCYECSVVGINASMILFGMICREQVHDLMYCLYCYFSENCFGCANLRRKKYCILNKQYSKNDYEKLVPRIIEHMQKTKEWGEFFPTKLSPFGYNESIANDHFPLNKETALNQKFKWSEYEAPFPKVDKIILAAQLPDNTHEAKRSALPRISSQNERGVQIPNFSPTNAFNPTDEILNWAIECEVTRRLFRITKQELKFYREQKLPLPRRHPDQRHKDRLALRNGKTLFTQKCPECGAFFQTTYNPNQTKKVYCKSCYLKILY